MWQTDTMSLLPSVSKSVKSDGDVRAAAATFPLKTPRGPQTTSRHSVRQCEDGLSPIPTQMIFPREKSD